MHGSPIRMVRLRRRSELTFLGTGCLGESCPLRPRMEAGGAAADGRSCGRRSGNGSRSGRAGLAAGRSVWPFDATWRREPPTGTDSGAIRKCTLPPYRVMESRLSPRSRSAGRIGSSGIPPPWTHSTGTGLTRTQKDLRRARHRRSTDFLGPARLTREGRGWGNPHAVRRMCWIRDAPRPKIPLPG